VPPVPDLMMAGVRPTDRMEHAAIGAWKKVAGPSVPTNIAIVQETQKSRVYRLERAGSDGVPVIAKSCGAATAAIERVIYEKVLPQLPVTTLRYYGHVDEGESCWLFLEEAGGVRFSVRLEEHRVIASRWLALMHTAATGVAAASRLPGRGTDYYLPQLRSARQGILHSRQNPKLSSSDRTVLEAVVAQCDVLESAWRRVDEYCEEIPHTLVHGDFRPKNARIRNCGDRTDLVTIDWETAGWGTPAVDLASARALPVNLIDVPTYCSIARGSWPGLDVRSILRLISVGWIFRRLAAISWESVKVASAWPQKGVASMRVYQAELADAIRGAGWTR